jgi:hypothetical protein
MRFESVEEQASAECLAARWLPELLSKVETGLRDMGATPRGSFLENEPSEVTDPAIALCIVRGRRLMELRFEKVFEAFLAVDHEAEPPRLDGRLFYEPYAEEKLDKIVKGRLAVVRAFARSRSHRDFMRRAERLVSPFDHVRVWGFKGRSRHSSNGARRKS